MAERLLHMLPPLAVVPTGPRTRAALDLLAAEVAHEEPGRDAVLNRLLDLVLVLALCAWCTRPQVELPSWYGTLSTPDVGDTLRLLHEDPAHRWTVAELAARVGPVPCHLRRAVPGPPLGVGGMPFEVSTLDLDPGSILALYTKGLVLTDEGLDSSMRRLASALAEECCGERSLEDAGHAVAERIGCPPREDLVLLLVRTRAVAPDRTADWTLPADPAVVARAREIITRQLTLWGLDELAFTTELVVSELVTNAIRYAGGPIRSCTAGRSAMSCAQVT